MNPNQLRRKSVNKKKKSEEEEEEEEEEEKSVRPFTINCSYLVNHYLRHHAAT